MKQLTINLLNKTINKLTAYRNTLETGTDTIDAIVYDSTKPTNKAHASFLIDNNEFQAKLAAMRGI